jgi:Pyruvate/2-oxoacid:ferredoxin oxidoreductase gamma subunit
MMNFDGLIEAASSRGSETITESIKYATARSQNPAYAGRTCGSEIRCGPAISSVGGGAAGT